ncbi:hypothetical protein TNCV_4826771 [Trichonephila clavipes]|nr:hypothetical protein TNCV_4826771 [Trichonephila clavipes]
MSHDFPAYKRPLSILFGGRSRRFPTWMLGSKYSFTSPGSGALPQEETGRQGTCSDWYPPILCSTKEIPVQGNVLGLKW